MNNETHNLIAEFPWAISEKGRVAIAIVWLFMKVSLEDIEKLLGVSVKPKYDHNSSQLIRSFQKDNVNFKAWDDVIVRRKKNLLQVLKQAQGIMEDNSLEYLLDTLEQHLALDASGNDSGGNNVSSVASMSKLGR